MSDAQDVHGPRVVAACNLVEEIVGVHGSDSSLTLSRSTFRTPTGPDSRKRPSLVNTLKSVLRNGDETKYTNNYHHLDKCPK